MLADRSDATQQSVPIDCARFQLCQPGGICDCTAMSCTAGQNGGVHFDLNLNLPKADGSVTGLDGDTHNAHLTKG